MPYQIRLMECLRNPCNNRRDMSMSKEIIMDKKHLSNYLTALNWFI